MISFLSDETVTLALRLAARQKLSVDDAVRQALEEKARAEGVQVDDLTRPKDRSPQAIEKRLARIQEITERIIAKPVRDHRSAQEIVDDINPL
jgi:hypothetical protein